MEKRSTHHRDSVVKAEKRVKLEPPASVRLMSQYPGILIATGEATGKEYRFPAAGSVLEVDAEDAKSLTKMVFGGNSCCGSGVKPTPRFIVVE